MRYIYTVYCLLIVSQFACKKEKAESDSSDDTEAGRLAIEPGEALEKMGSALSSVGEEGNIDPGALVIDSSGLHILSEDEDADGNGCDDSSGGPILDGNDGYYSGLFTYCNFVQPSNGPDTVQGAVHRVKSFLCAMGDELKFDGEEHKINFELNTDCFSDAWVKMSKEMGFESLEMTVVAKNGVADSFGNEKYEKSIEITADEIELHYYMTYMQDGDILAAAIQGGTRDAAQAGDVFAVYLDTGKEGVLRYEARFYSEESSPSVTHVRAFAEGVYDNEKDLFTEVTEAQFVNWRYFSGPNSTFMSLKGNEADGFRGIYMTASTDPYVFASYGAPSSKCYGKGDCSGNDGIYITSSDDLDFLKSVDPTQTVGVDPRDWFKDNGPLSFKKVTLDAVSE